MVLMDDNLWFWLYLLVGTWLGLNLCFVLVEARIKGPHIERCGSFCGDCVFGFFFDLFFFYFEEGDDLVF